MVNENCVIFKGRKGGLIVAIDENAAFEDIKETLEAKLKNAQKFFGNSDTSIIFRGRELTDAEEDELIDIIVKTSDLSIHYVKSTGVRILSAKTENNDMSAVSEAVSTEPILGAELNLDEHTTKYFVGSLRSGQSLQSRGSIVVVGDVNPGAEIIAMGNIIVLGALKGLAHAGCGGNEKCFVSAILMQPTQLRISDRITYVPTDSPASKRKAPNPLYAYVKDERICISTLI